MIANAIRAAIVLLSSGLFLTCSLAPSNLKAEERAEEPPSPRGALVEETTDDLPLANGMEPFPAILSEADADLYRRIFDLGEEGHWAEVDRLAERLSDRRLMGHVLAQRYLHRDYRTPFGELRDWMAAYHDHPQAERLYRLAQQRKPATAEPVVRPTWAQAGFPYGGGKGMTASPASKALSAEERSQAQALRRQVVANVRNTRLTITEEALAGPRAQRLLHQEEIDWGRQVVAAGWYFYGNYEKAFDLAAQAGRRSGHALPQAYWFAGLSAWRLERYEDAAWHFQQLAEHPAASGWNRSAGAYWAGRAALRLRRPEEMSRWLTIAAQQPRTFYGLLAHAALGMEFPFDFDEQALSDERLAALKDRAAGARTLALLQIGERERAEAELLGIDGWSDPVALGALLAAAERGGLPLLAFRVATGVSGDIEGDWPSGMVDAALYPIPPWEPEDGFEIDRALLFAFMRQESTFDPSAQSPAGARGLMQLMPTTARYIAEKSGVSFSRQSDLFDPELNIDLGQHYLAYLLESQWVEGDLLRLAVAYNGGPGNLLRWEEAANHGEDPLLFIESLPSRETRLFIEQVLANLWIYRLRLGQEVPSLEAMAAGEWPAYTPLEDEAPPSLPETQEALAEQTP